MLPAPSLRFLGYVVPFFLAFLSIATANELRVAGSNDYGQLGNGQSDYYNRFEKLADNVSKIDLSDVHGFYTDTDGKTWGIGGTWPGLMGDFIQQDGDYYSHTPILISETLEDFWIDRQASFYRYKDDARLWGSGTSSPSIPIWEGDTTRSSPATVFDLENITQAAADWTAAAYLTEEGDLYGIGYRFAFGNTETGLYAEPTLIETDVVEIGFATYSCFYLKENGELHSPSSGNQSPIAQNVTRIAHSGNSRGDILYIDNLSNLKLIGKNGGSSVQIAQNVREVTTDNDSSFYITYDNTLWVRGTNRNGTWGTEDFADAATPIAIRENVLSIATNSATLWVLDQDQSLHASGFNAYGILGYELAPQSKLPLPIDTNINEVAMSDDTVYYINQSNELLALGRNDYGQLGIGGHFPVQVPTKVFDQVASVSSNGTQALFITQDGNLYGMGDNSYDQLAGTYKEYILPRKISANIQSASSGRALSAFVDQEGSLYTVGINNRSFRKIADSVIAYDTFDELAYIKSDGSLIVRDSNFISSYRTATEQPFSGSEIALDNDAIAVAIGYRFVAYIKSDQSLWLVGDISFLAGVNESFTPIPIKVDTKVSKVDAAYKGIVYQKSDGSLWTISQNINFLPPSITAPVRRPTQIWKHTTIHDFELTTTNLALIAAPLVAPSIEAIDSTTETTAKVGERVELSLDSQGGFSKIQWFSGSLGNRDNPIANSDTTRLQLYLYRSGAYWVEIVNEAGSASEQIQIDVDFPAYGDWAEANNLLGAQALYSNNSDGDRLPNIVEFAFGFDPQTPDYQTSYFSMDHQNKILEITFPNNPREDIAATIQVKPNSSSEWIDSSEMDDLEIAEDAHSRTYSIPLKETNDTLLVRLSLAPRP